MPELQAQRRLVKSPPELWTEVSDAASLARHLGELGEITITRVEPESTVAWEGERASGTVELEPAGWGTRVTLTARAAGAEAEPEPSAVAAEPAVPEAVAELEPEAAEPAPPPPAADPPARDSLLRRLFRRRAAATASAVEAGRLPTATEPAPTATPDPAPEPQAPAPVAETPPPSDDPLQGVLTAALDSLGSAHHRPFSRG